MKNNIHTLSPGGRRAELVHILSKAVRRLAKNLASSPEPLKNYENKAESSLTPLDLSPKTRLHVCRVNNDNSLEHKEL
jgi:hypothetical protein